MQNTARQTRENRTITVDFQNEATYVQLLGDGKAFVEFVIAFILSFGFQLKHKAMCRGGGCLTRHSHYLRVRLGGVTIWRLQCTIEFISIKPLVATDSGAPESCVGHSTVPSRDRGYPPSTGGSGPSRCDSA